MFEIAGAEKLTAMSGATGESIDIANADDIKYITDNINALQYSKDEKVDGDGWSYALQWFDRNGEIIEKLIHMGDSYTIIYDRYYYDGAGRVLIKPLSSQIYQKQEPERAPVFCQVPPMEAARGKNG